MRLGPDEWMTALGVSVWDAAMRERVEALQWAVAKELLLIGNTVIVEWGTWARSERDALRLQAREVGAAVHLLYLDVAKPVTPAHAVRSQPSATALRRFGIRSCR